MKQGTKAIVSKNYFSHNGRFAEICNHGLFHGEPVLEADRLQEQDSIEQTVSGIMPENVEALWKARDILKRYEDGATFLVIGIENQTEIHYCMPLRNLLYDALNYEEQRRKIAKEHLEKKDLAGSELLSGFAKTDRLNPVFTLVLYYGEKEWDGARTLTELLNIPEELVQYKDKLLDYKINLLDVNRIENLEDYSDELKAVFGFLKYQKEKNALIAFVGENEDIYKNLSPESMQAIAVLGNFREVEKVLKNDNNDGEERVDMCQAIQEMLEDARNEVREEMNEAIAGMLEDARKETREEMNGAIAGMLEDARKETREEMNEAIAGMLEDARKETREEMNEAIAGMLEDARKETREEMRKERKRIERENMIQFLIEDNLEEGIKKERILSKLIQKFELSLEDAEQYYNRYATT